MGKVKLKDSSILSDLSYSINKINWNMQDNLKILNDAFAVAQEGWKDKNAQTCQNALDGHNSVMYSAFERLEELSAALSRLSQLAAQYEDI